MIKEYRYIAALIAMLAAISVIGCFRSSDSVFLRADERADVEIVKGRAGLIRTVYCDIYIEYVDADGWNYIRKNSTFRGDGIGYPVKPCFFIIVVNTWNRPVVVEKVESLYNGKLNAAEDFSFIRDPDYAASRYSVNLDRMMKPRRLLSDGDIFEEIDFDEDSLEYRLDFIAPGDRVSFFRFFRRVPGGKSSKISMTIKYFDMKKVIDFDIGRFDYTDIIDLR